MKTDGKYLNRETSWLNFNERVLQEAEDPRVPLLERVRFLSIFESNLDEFYMVRVSGLIEQFESGTLETSPDGLTPNDQLTMITQLAGPLRVRAGRHFEEQIVPALDAAGIAIRSLDDLSERARRELQHLFHREIFPVCTPLVLYPATSMPFISNRSLNLAIELRDGTGETRLARLKIPNSSPRLIRVGKRKHEYVRVEDLVAANLQSFFPGVEILSTSLFRVIRDADVEIREIEAADLLAAIEETLRLRRFGAPVLLQHDAAMPEAVLDRLLKLLELDDEDAMPIPGVIGMEALLELARIDRPALRFPPHRPHLDEELGSYRTLFERIRQGPVLVHHPYDSFRTVEEFVASAAKDPDVIGIKTTLYRVGQESPLVESLLAAAEAGKQVAAMVELKARFDEGNNLVWARALEQAGVHVTYGFRELKTHCKLCLVVRREPRGVRQYVHVGTGNYNPATARIYTDLGFFTDDEGIAQDASELFNVLTGFSRQTKYRKLLVAPSNLREGIVTRIRREIRSHKAKGGGRIFWKLNALVDPEFIDALYEASAAGVRVDLIVRGVCCLRPNVPGLSDHIRVRSVVGRFLEHSRVYAFAHGGSWDVLIGSADAMRRNLDRRIEVLAPIEDPDLARRIVHGVLEPGLRDNQGAWTLHADGSYHRVSPAAGEKAFDSQAYFVRHPLGDA